MSEILVVDDSVTDRRLAGGLLEKVETYSVTYATNGKDALERLATEPPDLVLTDLQMPEMDGLELVSQMKSHYPEIPVILMTAKGSEEIAVEALRVGAASYVPKRRLAKDLTETVQMVLASSQVDQFHAEVMCRLVRNDCSFAIENRLPLIGSMARYLRQLLKAAFPGEEASHVRIGVALEEALMNAYYHGNLEISSELRQQDHKAFYDLAKVRCGEFPYSERCIYVDASFSPSQILFVVRDDGPGFDPATLPDPSDPANLERPSGRGVMLMRTFMDEVVFSDRGNEVTLVKKHSQLTNTKGESEARS